MSLSPFLQPCLARKRRKHGRALHLRVLPEIRRVEHLLRARPPRRIQTQQAREQPASGAGEEREFAPDHGAVRRGVLGQAQRARVRETPEPWPGFFRRDAAELEDLGQLVDFVGALQEWLARQQLAEDAAHGPHVDGWAVFVGAEEEFGRAVPEGHDQLGKLGRWVAVVPCHAEIGDLEGAAVVEEEVGGLEIAVEDPVFVEVADTGDKLVEESFGFGGEEGLGEVFEEGLEVVFEEVEDEEDAVL